MIYFFLLFFFFRHGLKREFGILQGVPRAKKSLYIPTVLSRSEIDAILGQLSRTHKLVVQLLFGCGLRLFECLQLRVGDFNFDTGKLLAHGKGKKDRTVPIPDTITTELKAQIARVGKLHDQDLAEGYDGVFLDDAIEIKYPKAPKEFIYQWFFPQKDLTLVAETGQRRRSHLHESDFQRALYPAVAKTKIPKRVKSHSFRHFFATHSVAGRLRHSCHSDAVGALQPENYHDLYPLCPCQDGERAEKPAGLLIPIPNQGAIFVSPSTSLRTGSSSAPQRTNCTPSSPHSSPP